MKTKKILVAGIGNSFRCDDRAGLLVCDLIEDALKGLSFIIIKTYSIDKYDRYLTDIFYLKSGVEQKVLEKGEYL
ncbi:MAG: hypothetical protein HY965_00020, partial [Ignavibacteriales bacterium]|nr:hypothetical protein [Ignavibacteriales bacterium]